MVLSFFPMCTGCVLVEDQSLSIIRHMWVWESCTLMAVESGIGGDAVGNPYIFWISFVVYVCQLFSVQDIAVNLWCVPVLDIIMCLLAVLDTQDLHPIIVNVCTCMLELALKSDANFLHCSNLPRLWFSSNMYSPWSVCVSWWYYKYWMLM